ncbi:MAG: DrmB family protein [Polyangiaceae bacterium]
MAARKPFGSKTIQSRPDGQIRQSQLVMTFGPGAMVDLIDSAIVVGGLDFWKYDGGAYKRIDEPRLRDAIRRRGGKLAEEDAFRAPPEGNDQEPTRQAGVLSLEFPQWFVCQNDECRALRRSHTLTRKGTRYIHDCTRGKSKATECVPSRFVVACKNGHLDEFPWVGFAHHYERDCSNPLLEIVEGASGDFADIFVRCTSCRKERRLADAQREEANPACSGKQPWLGGEGRVPCDQKQRLLVRTASNSYFAQVMSALSIPLDESPLTEPLDLLWEYFETATLDDLRVIRKQKRVAGNAALAGVDDATLMAAIEAKRNAATSNEALRSAEFRVLLDQPAEASGDLPPEGAPFYARRIVPNSKVPPSVSAVVAIKKLREVRAQVGFTRIAAPAADLQGEFEINVRTAPLGLTPKWLPATEVFGEGVFLQFREEAVRAWEERPAVLARAKELLAGYDLENRHRDEAPPFLGARFYLLHSIAHLLISAISWSADTRRAPFASASTARRATTRCPWRASFSPRGAPAAREP